MMTAEELKARSTALAALSSSLNHIDAKSYDITPASKLKEYDVYTERQAYAYVRRAIMEEAVRLASVLSSTELGGFSRTESTAISHGRPTTVMYSMPEASSSFSAGRSTVTHAGGITGPVVGSMQRFL